ncbi:MAG: hypothetical protein LIP05_16880, partial [Tannerellaceae bacterium]|nr:hypothetical protein [Tannerellaceae bacterium]
PITNGSSCSYNKGKYLNLNILQEISSKQNTFLAASELNQKKRTNWKIVDYLSELLEKIVAAEKLEKLDYHDYDENGKINESTSVYYSRVARSILKYINKVAGTEFRLKGACEKAADLADRLIYWNGSYWMEVGENPTAAVWLKKYCEQLPGR